MTKKYGVKYKDDPEKYTECFKTKKEAIKWVEMMSGFKIVEAEK